MGNSGSKKNKIQEKVKEWFRKRDRMETNVEIHTDTIAILLDCMDGATIDFMGRKITLLVEDPVEKERRKIQDEIFWKQIEDFPP